MERPGRLCQVNEFRHRLKFFDCPTKLLHGSTKCTHRDLFMSYEDAYVTQACSSDQLYLAEFN